jgi:hypothetical protein
LHSPVFIIPSPTVKTPLWLCHNCVVRAWNPSVEHLLCLFEWGTCELPEEKVGWFCLHYSEPCIFGSNCFICMELAHLSALALHLVMSIFAYVWKNTDKSSNRT